MSQNEVQRDTSLFGPVWRWLQHSIQKHLHCPCGADNAVLAAQLRIVGGCHRAAEKSRLAGLRQLAQDLGLQDCVEFLPNALYEDISSLLGGAVGGLHTMLDEHFGISIVEYMAAGKRFDVTRHLCSLTAAETADALNWQLSTAKSLYWSL